MNNLVFFVLNLGKSNRFINYLNRILKKLLPF